MEANGTELNASKRDWTDAESEALCKGMLRHGLKVNKWVLIKNDTELGPALVNRSNNNLKDRWRAKVFDTVRAELDERGRLTTNATEYSAPAAKEVAPNPGSPKKSNATAPKLVIDTTQLPPSPALQASTSLPPSTSSSDDEMEDNQGPRERAPPPGLAEGPRPVNDSQLLQSLHAQLSACVRSAATSKGNSGSSSSSSSNSSSSNSSSSIGAAPPKPPRNVTGPELGAQVGADTSQQSSTTMRPKVDWTDIESEALRKGMARHGLQLNKWQLIKEDPEFKDILVNRTNGNLKDRWRNRIYTDTKLDLEAAAQEASEAAGAAMAAAREARETAAAKYFAESTRQAAVGVFQRATSAIRATTAISASTMRHQIALRRTPLQELTFRLDDSVKGLILSVLEGPEDGQARGPWGLVVKTILPGGSGERAGLREGDVIKSAGGTLLQRLPNESEDA